MCGLLLRNSLALSLGFDSACLFKTCYVLGDTRSGRTGMIWAPAVIPRHFGKIVQHFAKPVLRLTLVNVAFCPIFFLPLYKVMTADMSSPLVLDRLDMICALHWVLDASDCC